MDFTKADIYWLIGADCLLPDVRSIFTEWGKINEILEWIQPRANLERSGFLGLYNGDELSKVTQL